MKSFLLFTLLCMATGISNAKVNLEKVKASAEAGDASAQYELGWNYANGTNGLAKDYSQAISWLEKSACSGYSASSYYLGFLYRLDEGVERNYGKAYECFFKAMKEGMVEAKEYAEYSKKQFEDDAVAGNALYQYQLGTFYAQGQNNYPKDNAMSVMWLDRASANGYGPASLKLGELYNAGEGVEVDIYKALKYYNRANIAGMEEAKKLQESCIRSMESAANSGNKDLQYYLGLSYANGDFGLQKDYTKAVSLLEKAAESGIGMAANYLGGLYREGTNVDKNIEKAYNWYTKAANLGIKDAGDMAIMCKKELGAIQQKKAETENSPKAKSKTRVQRKR